MAVKIVITGAEASGKTTLCKELAKFYNTLCIEEYARDYIENLGRKYTYDDVVHIAKKQIELEKKYLSEITDFLFVDTSLIITKVWFDVVFKKIPDWLENAIIENMADFYLLCAPDLPWIPDKVRENGGKMRLLLFDRYKNELLKYNAKFSIISGKSNIRTQKAIDILENFKKDMSLNIV